MSQETSVAIAEDPAAAAPRPAFWERYSRPLTALAAILVFSLLGIAIYKLTEEVRYRDVIHSLGHTHTSSIALALLFTALSFATLCLYDFNALAFIRRKLPRSEVLLTAFSAYAVGNVAGFGALSGGAIRYRAYTRAGLRPEEIAKVIAFVTLSFSLGLVLITALLLLPLSPEIGDIIGISPRWLQAFSLATLVLAATAAILGRGRGLRLGRFTLRLADTKTLSRQFLVTVLDLAFSASVLYALLPGGTDISWPAFFAIYTVAIGIGVISHVPAGLGVFDAVMVAALGDTAGTEGVLAALVAYRLIYYAFPLTIAIILVTLAELHRFATGALPATFFGIAARIAPPLIGTLAFLLGAMLVFSGVTPTPRDNLELLQTILPLPILEGAHFLASVLGVLLVIAARGLTQRLDGAWWVSLATAALALVLSLLKSLAVVEATLLGLFLLSLFSSRKLFRRPASLFRQTLTSSWLMAIAVLCLAAVLLLLFIYRDLDYSQELWWQFEFKANAPRSLRAMMGIGVMASAVALFSLLRPASLPLPGFDDQAGADAARIAMEQDVADANLVRTGDKSVLLAPEGDAFVMYGRHGRSCIAFLDPVGDARAGNELVWTFVEAARAAGCRAVFYQVSPALLPAIADTGLQAYKLGETAIVDLAHFDLKGGRWANLRQTAARAERDGLSFELLAADCVPDVLDALREVSDAWLREHRAREKGFSLGAFSDAYLRQQPVAVLRFEGRIVAFANVLLTETKQEASVDLMRFAPDAPKGAMDYLFVSLLTRLRADGHRTFNLGMAPLAGLSRREISPVWDRIANTFYEHGERFYNFKGLRAFKSKFHPEWQPRYLAVAGGINPVLALIDATLLIGGGLKGVVKK
ncbi:bifunctional lysylphosphatidylglycerol flippase/synthetase MprF [Rhizobium halophytocola]|uniref:Phosphatidylglycerol lysyltransferase n=1 Tax=Rhizobium halophytocola TaxID=735519 RepID=A0ABS4E284_9HYPH|nr:bifunctional lysylphosphatidylglycerol flippase/synthetase MprF [Rhizobium halophytocola]MBP1852056.1 phosphatidylglycerol lysyltransferase [Rhizobium halophytocola]